MKSAGPSLRTNAAEPPAFAEPQDSTAHGITGKPWWPWLKRGLTAAFFALVAYLLYTQARAIAWDEVLGALRAYPLSSLMAAVGLAATSLLLYSCFDLLGRHYTAHPLGTAKVISVTFISYVFNLNLGSLVGGVAFRYRLYTRLGLAYGTITRILSLSMLTNWVGYVLLAGAVFSWRPLPLPPDWKINGQGLQYLGFALLAVGLSYLAMSAFSSQRSFTLRGHELALPSFRLALLQATMGVCNWLLISAIIYALLQQKVAFEMVVSVLLVAAVAGVITHVPAGLGVLEAVFVALLSHQVPKSSLLAALVAYRFIYYLGPLAVATALYLFTEARADGSKADADQDPPKPA
jgi:uncharacterized membrane protein YbhN (UPF0104 family)